MKTITLPIASDHAGYDLKADIMKTFHTAGDIQITWLDMGPGSADRCDYPDYAHKVASLVGSGKHSLGLLICGSGIGMSIAANKTPGVRAAVVESDTTARLARQHNNANILCIGSRIVTADYAKQIITAWLTSTFEEGRHADRLRKISELEGGNHGKPN